MNKQFSLAKSFCRLLAGALCLAISHERTAAQYANVPVTGFTADLVADGVRPASDPGSTSIATTNGVDAGNFVFIDGTYQYSSTCPTYTTAILPASNQIASTAAAGLTYTLQPYTGLNALRIPASGLTGLGSGTLTLQTPTSMARLYLLVVAGSWPSSPVGTVSVSVTFTDATTQQLLTNATVADWCTGANVGATTFIPGSYNRVDATASGTCGGTVATCQYFHEMSLPISGANYGKQVASVTITKNQAGGIFNVFAMGMLPPCAVPSTSPTALTQGATTINSIAGSFTAASSAPTGYLVVRYPSGATVTAPEDGVTYTAGAALGTGTVVQSGTSTSFTTTGLSGSTAYDFYVYSYNNTSGTCGGPVYLSASPLTATLSTSPCSSGVAAGTYSIGPTGSPYTSLTQALTAISNSGVAGPVVLELQAAYTSTGETFPLTLTNSGCLNATNNVVIRPEAGASNLLITSANTTATIDINTGAFFSIDGRPGGIGTAQALTIQNTATAGVAVRYINEAMKNRITYCNIQGVNTSATGGVVQFATTSGANGNDSNAITFCNISGTSSANTPTTLIYSSGSTATTAQYNSNDTVANCNLYDFFNATAESNGFKLGNGNGGNANWAILNNSFYQTVARTVTGTSTQYPMNLNCPNAFGYLVTGNFIGGSAPQCGGGAWTVSGAGNSRFVGAYFNLLTGGTPQSVFSGNTFSNFSWTATTSTTNTSAPGTWGGLQFIGGNLAVTGNTFGSTTSNTAISVTTTASAISTGITAGSGNATTTYNVTGNTIAGITTNTATAGSAYHGFTGIIVNGGAVTTTYNVGTNAVTNIFANTVSTGAQVVRGIEITTGSSARVNVVANTIRNFTNNVNSTSGQTAGIYATPSTTGVDSIAGNIVGNLHSASTATAVTNAASVIGILHNANTTGSTAGAAVNQNRVFNLYNSAATANVGMVGIVFSAPYTNATTVTGTLAGNFVHSIATASTGTGATIAGIRVSQGVANVQNNMVRLGIDSNGNAQTVGHVIAGIIDLASTSNASNYYHNSVYIGGAGVNSTAATSNTYAFFGNNTSGTRSVQNNIFSNARSNGAGTAASHYGMNIGGSANYSSNGNVVYFPGTNAQFGQVGGALGAAGGTSYATLLQWQSATGQDGNSAAADPQFIAPAANSTAVDLHINPTAATPVEAAGLAGTPVTQDYDGQARTGLTPVDIGADAGNFVPQDVLPPAIVYTPIASNYNTGNQTLTATITDATGVPTTGPLVPRIYYRKGSGSYTSAAGTLVSGTAQNGSWNFTINAAALGGLTVGDSVFYYVVAQDVAGNTGSNPVGVVATDVNTITTPPTPNAFRILSYLSGVINVGTGGTFTTLTAAGGAFQQIVLNGLSGDLTLRVVSDLTENGANALTQWPETGVGNYKVRIVPDGTTERLVTGSVAAPGMIRLSGVRRVAVDGRFNGAGRFLRFRNTSTSGSVFTLINDATADSIAYSFIESATTSSGAILFSTAATGGTGNDNNYVVGNAIRDLSNTAGVPTTGLNSSGTASPADNSDNVISSNEFLNFSANGINLTGTGTGNNWQITSNAFYQTATRSTAMDVIYVQAGSGHLISNNSIGGSAADRSGAATTNTAGVTVNAIRIAAGVASPTVVSGNTISNMAMTTTSTSGTLNGILVSSGTVNITGNTIGGGMQPYDTMRNGYDNGMISVSGGTVNITGNLVKNIAYYRAGGDRNAAMSISGGTATITNNTIDNIRSNGSGTGYSFLPLGIIVSGGSGHSVTGNTISNVISTNTGTSAYTAAGISITGSTGSTFSRNRISRVYGSGTGTGTGSVVASGIYVSSTSVETFSNNQISLGDGTTGETRVYGIQDVSAGSNTHNYFNNSVYLSGTTSGGSNNSYALFRTSTTPFLLRNNIFYNGRTTGGTGFNYAVGFSNATGYAAPSSNYNLLIAADTSARLVEVPSGTGLGAGAYGATYTTVPNANWMSNTAGVTPAQLFADVTTGNLAVVPTNPESWYVNGKGLPLAAVPTDYAGAPRSTTIPGGAIDIGSTEFFPATLPPSATASAAPAPNTTTTYTFGGRTIARFVWDAGSTPPSGLDVKMYSDSTAPNTGGAPVFNTFYDINPTGGSSYGYTVDLAYDSSMLGTVLNSADARLAKYPAGGPWTQYAASTANPVTGFLSSNTTLNSFSLFTGGSAAVPLAVEALQVSARADGDVNRIDWSALRTATGDRFIVERSSDGIDFSELATVSATGMTRYTHRDIQPLTGTSYYRIGLANAAGAVRWSNVASVRRSAVGSFALSVSPNPVTTVARVMIAGDVPADASLIVSDMTGRIIHTQTAVSGEMMVDMGGLQVGTYLLQYRAAGRSEVVKVVKQ